MKKILSLMLVLIFLVGCSSVKNNNIPEGDDIMNEIITETELYDVEWNQIQFPVSFSENVLGQIKAINSNGTAINIGKSIIAELHKEGKLSEFTLVSITHSVKDNVWFFVYSIDQKNIEIDKLIDCGCLYVAIDGNKGDLICAWSEE